MNRRIRDPYVRWCEGRTPSYFGAEPSTRLAHVFPFRFLLISPPLVCQIKIQFFSNRSRKPGFLFFRCAFKFPSKLLKFRVALAKPSVPLRSFFLRSALHPAAIFSFHAQLIKFRAALTKPSVLLGKLFKIYRQIFCFPFRFQFPL